MNGLQTALVIAFVAMLIVTRASNWPGFELATVAIGTSYVASVYAVLEEGGELWTS